MTQDSKLTAALAVADDQVLRDRYDLAVALKVLAASIREAQAESVSLKQDVVIAKDALWWVKGHCSESHSEEAAEARKIRNGDSICLGAVAHQALSKLSKYNG